MDEVHFQQHGSRCRLWIPPEVQDPVCLHAPTRKSISYFGAVRLKDGKLVMSPPEGMFNAATCWDFLRKLEETPHQLNVLGNGRQEKPYLYVSDLVDGILMAVEQAVVFFAVFAYWFVRFLAEEERRADVDRPPEAA